MPELKRIPINEIEPPSRSEKLHPVEKEEAGDSEETEKDVDDEKQTWPEFRQSVGIEPDKPIEVRENGAKYELIDGDRRYRAVEANYDMYEGQGQEFDQEDILAYTFDRDEISDEEFYLRRLRANDQREEDDPVQRAWYYAQFVAPWLLPPGERMDDIEMMTQAEFAEKVGISQGAVSNRLRPMREEHTLRQFLGDVGSGYKNRPKEDEIETVDEIVNLLLTIDESGHRVVPENQLPVILDKMDEMYNDYNLSLGEIHQMAEKARENGWNHTTFAEELNDFIGSDEGVASGSFESGYVEQDTSEEQTKDGDPENADDGSQPLHPNADEPEPDEGEESVLGEPPEVDWSQYVADSDLPGDLTVERLANRRRSYWEVEDDVAVAVKMLAEATGEDPEEVLHRYCGHAIVNSVIDYFVGDDRRS